MMKLLLYLPLLTWGIACTAQPSFNRTYRDGEGNMARSVIVTDSGYLVCGNGYSQTYNGWLVAKFLTTDSAGNFDAIKLLGEVTYGYTIGYPGSLTQTFDGNYILGGSIIDSGAVTSQGILCKLDKHGDTLWMRRFGRRSIDHYYFERARPTRDGGYITIGKWKQGQALNFYAIKTDSTGQLLWQRSYGRPGLGHGYSVEQASDGGFIMAGVSDADGTGSGKVVPYVVKTDSAGHMQWQKEYATSGFHGPASIIPSIYGGYYLLVDLETNALAEQFYLYRLDSAGTIIWTYTFPSVEDTYIGQVLELADGSSVAVGQTPLPGIFWSGGMAIKISPTGQLVWQREYPRYNLAGINVQGGFQSFRQTTDLGYVIAGGAIVDTGGGNYLNDFWLVKTDSMGCIRADCGVTGVNELTNITNAEQMMIWPNPTQNIVNIEWNEEFSHEIQMSFFDLLGKEVFCFKFVNGLSKAEINVTGLTSGLYVIKLISSDGKSIQGKLAVNHR